MFRSTDIGYALATSWLFSNSPFTLNATFDAIENLAIPISGQFKEQPQSTECSEIQSTLTSIF